MKLNDRTLFGMVLTKRLLQVAIVCCACAGLAFAAPPDGKGGGNGGGGGGGGGGGEDPPADPAIVYLDARDNLMVMNADGTNQTKILSKAGNIEPAISPDGSFVVFNQEFDGVNGIWMINTDGTDFHLVTEVLDPVRGSSPPVAISPVPAPDGYYKIAYRDEVGSSEVWDVYVVNLDGSDPQQLTDNSANGRSANHLAWSPDATQLLVGDLRYGDAFVFTLGLDGSGSIEITGEINVTKDFGGPLAGLTGGCMVDWANTDQDLILVGARFPDDNRDVWLIDLTDPGNPIQMTWDFNDERFPSFLWDDSAIIYQRAAWSTGDKDGVVELDLATGDQTMLAPRGQVPDA